MRVDIQSFSDPVGTPSDQPLGTGDSYEPPVGVSTLLLLRLNTILLNDVFGDTPLAPSFPKWEKRAALPLFVPLPTHEPQTPSVFLR